MKNNTLKISALSLIAATALFGGNASAQEYTPLITVINTATFPPGIVCRSDDFDSTAVNALSGNLLLLSDSAEFPSGKKTINTLTVAGAAFESEGQIRSDIFSALCTGDFKGFNLGSASNNGGLSIYGFDAGFEDVNVHTSGDIAVYGNTFRVSAFGEVHLIDFSSQEALNNQLVALLKIFNIELPVGEHIDSLDYNSKLSFKNSRIVGDEVVLRNVSISNYHGDKSMAVRATGASRISDAEIYENSNTGGGGAIYTYSDLFLENVYFADNIAGSETETTAIGGAVFCNGNAVLSGANYFTGNKAVSGTGNDIFAKGNIQIAAGGSADFGGGIYGYDFINDGEAVFRNGSRSQIIRHLVQSKSGIVRIHLNDLNLVKSTEIANALQDGATVFEVDNEISGGYVEFIVPEKASTSGATYWGLSYGSEFNAACTATIDDSANQSETDVRAVYLRTEAKDGKLYIHHKTAGNGMTVYDSKNKKEYADLNTVFAETSGEISAQILKTGTTLKKSVSIPTPSRKIRLESATTSGSGLAVERGAKFRMSSRPSAEGNNATESVVFTTRGLNIYGVSQWPLRSAHSNTTASEPENGGLFELNDDFTLVAENSTYRDFTVSGNGGVIYTTEELTLSGAAGYFSNNSAGGNGGAIWADDDIIITSSDVNFSGNTANGKPNDIYLAGDDEIVFRTGSCTIFEGGINAARGGSLVFETGSYVVFEKTATNQIGGSTVFRKHSMINFGEETTSTFSGGIVVEAGHRATFGGNVAVGKEIRLNFDANSTAYASADFSQTQSVRLDAGTQLILDGLNPRLLGKNILDGAFESELVLIYAKGTELAEHFTQELVAESPVWFSELKFDADNNLLLRTVRKAAEHIAKSVGGNAGAALALGYEDAIDTESFDEARRNASAASGELVASQAHVATARARASIAQTSHFLANEIGGSSRNPAGTQTAAAYFPRDRRVFQAATADGMPGGAATAQAESLQDFGWEIAFAYIGQRGDVAADGAYAGYDYKYNGSWLGMKKALSGATAGLALELGFGETKGAGSKIETDAWGLNAFVFVPIADGAFYAFAQGGISLGDNELTRNLLGKNHKGSFDSQTRYAQAEAGTNLGLASRLKLNPYVSVAYTCYDADGFSDGGNAYGSFSFDDAEIKPGVRLRSDFDLGETKCRVSLGLAWTHRFSDDDADLTAARNGASATVRGNAGDSDFAEASLDFGVALTQSLNLSAGYAYSDGSDLEEHNFYARLGWKF